MKTPLVRATLTAVAVALVLATPPSQAIAPIIALLGKQILKEMFITTAKGMLLDSLSGMGCKGQALANAITSVGNLTSARGLPGGMGGMSMPPGMGMPAGMAMPTMPGMPAGMSMPNMPNMPNVPGMPGMGGLPPDMAAMMARLMPAGAMPPGMALDPEQAAMLAKIQGSMSAPLSPVETLATIDEMSELGLLNKAMNTELKECMLLMPQTVPMMGMAMGMMKPILPKLRDAREQMRALSPEEQDELAANLASELDKAPAADRKAMLGELDGGLFPPRVAEALNTRYGTK
jgi:hypothetical protein